MMRTKARRVRREDGGTEEKALSRRAVLRTAASLAGAGSAAWTARAGAAEPGARSASVAGQPPYVPRPDPTQYVLRVGRSTMNPDGKKPMPAVVVNQRLPGPEIRMREGDSFRAAVENGLGDGPTAIHWHGVLVPAGMDGVPGVSTTPIPPGQVYIYEYPIRQSGTYWYHSHVGFQEQMGCFGPFIIEPRDEPLRTDHDAVVMLSDWLHRSPEEVFAELRGRPAAAPGGMPGMQGMAAMARKGGADLSDVKYDAFLLNGKAPDAPWTLAARPGERIRLRLVNAGASTYFQVKLDGHPLQVTHADGLAVEPVTVDHLLMGMAESYDVVVALGKAGSYTLHATAQDGSGQAIGVLHTPDAKPEPNRAMPTFSGKGLEYAALRAPASTVLPAGPRRTFRLPLQGDMAKYVWMIDGQVWPDADPLLIEQGERVEIELVNQTMMWHPMHLHGHFFRVLQGAGDRCPLKHTVNVAPGQTVKIEFGADNPGRWFFHCHNTYHLEAGMAREFVYRV
jgi:multicopper oxidase